VILLAHLWVTLLEHLWVDLSSELLLGILLVWLLAHQSGPVLASLLRVPWKEHSLDVQTMAMLLGHPMVRWMILMVPQSALLLALRMELAWAVGWVN
jgi:hypothetical protein